MITYGTIFTTIPTASVYRADDLQKVAGLKTRPPLADIDNLKLVTLVNMDGKQPAFVVERA